MDLITFVLACIIILLIIANFGMCSEHLDSAYTAPTRSSRSASTTTTKTGSSPSGGQARSSQGQSRGQINRLNRRDQGQDQDLDEDPMRQEYCMVQYQDCLNGGEAEIIF